MEVIGTLGAIVGIVDVATRSISTLNDLRSRYKEIEFTADFICARLGVMKAALEQIHALINESFRQEQFYKLVMSLEFAIKCSNILIRRLDEQISQLEYGADDSLEFRSKIKMTLESKGTEECLRMLDSQMGAFSCLISALTARDIVRQKNILESKDVIKVFDKLRDDTTSLHVLCDSASFATRRTSSTNFTSKYSINSFDIQLLQHKAYKATLKSLLRRAHLSPTKENGNNNGGSSLERKALLQSKLRSTEIDDYLLQSADQRRRTIKVLVLGQETALLVNTMKRYSGTPMSESEHLQYRLKIYQHIALVLQGHLQRMHDDIATKGTLLLSRIEPNHSTLSHALDRLAQGTDSADIKELEKALCYIASKKDVLLLSELAETGLINDLDRFLEPEYVPTEEDIKFLLTDESFRATFRETFLTTKYLDIQMIENPPLSGKHMNMFGDTTCIVFVVDLTCYDRSDDPECNTNSMMELLTLFDRVVSSQCFSRSRIILILLHPSKFKEKLQKVPLSTYFPEFSGGADIDEAVKHIIWRFNQANRGGLQIYSHLFELHDTAILRIVFTTIQDTIISDLLKRSGVL